LTGLTVSADGDFSTFYLTGEIIRDGEGDRALRSGSLFRARQEELHRLPKKTAGILALSPPCLSFFPGWQDFPTVSFIALVLGLVLLFVGRLVLAA